MKLTDWLETHWVTPAYSGWLLSGIALCFFGAATNTMAGWLYVLSATIFALLGLAAVLPARSLRQLKVRRLPIDPVSAGDDLTIEVTIENLSQVPKTLLQVRDLLPYVLSQPRESAIEIVPPQQSYRWVYYTPARRRGVYRWHEIQLRTATPLGLFWCRRDRDLPIKAVVYPTVLSLTQCPLVDTFGQDENTKLQSDRRYQAAPEGVTKTLRSYRQGDPLRLIHWRSSARFEEFKVRELEVITGGQEIVIGLDTAAEWEEDTFEQAAIAAASLYFYASRSQLNVKLWTASTGLVHGNRVVLETLAASSDREETNQPHPTNLSLIWLTQNPSSVPSLAAGSRWIFFSRSHEKLPTLTHSLAGMAIDPNQPLQLQLQKPLK